MTRLIVAALAVAVFAGDSVACPGLLGRLRARVAARSGGGGCFGGGQQQQFQQQDQGDGGFQQGQDQTQPNDDPVRFARPGFAPTWFVPAQNPPPVPMPASVAPPAAALPPAASPPPVRAASAEPPSVAPKAVADDIITPPGVGIAAVEARTTKLEKEVADLKLQLAQIYAIYRGNGQPPPNPVQTRSTVYLSGSAPVQAAPAPYQTIPVQSVPVYYGQPVYRLGGSTCGPNGCPR